MNNQDKTCKLSEIRTLNAISLAGGPAQIARNLGVSVMAVCHWRKQKRIPPKRCIQIERMIDGAVTRAQMRPDIFG